MSAFGRRRHEAVPEGYLASRAFRRSRPDERARGEVAVMPDTSDGERDLELGEERSEHVPDAVLASERQAVHV